mmetsp:Transcript_22621/g.57551  ORF Transcript_22621/g.57551 Transcript_22621/m.57551 type:complete len:208 (-) Transcript_22621:327-950(-)
MVAVFMNTCPLSRPTSMGRAVPGSVMSFSASYGSCGMAVVAAKSLEVPMGRMPIENLCRGWVPALRSCLCCWPLLLASAEVAEGLTVRPSPAPTPPTSALKLSCRPPVWRSSAAVTSFTVPSPPAATSTSALSPSATASATSRSTSPASYVTRTVISWPSDLSRLTASLTSSSPAFSPCSSTSSRLPLRPEALGPGSAPCSAVTTAL